MDVEVVDKKENPLLNRTEVTFRVTHEKEKTPQRSAVRDKLAQAVGGKKDGVVVTRMRSRYGSAVTSGFAKVYKSADDARSTEPIHLLKRNGLYVEKKKAEKKEGEAAAAAA